MPDLGQSIDTSDAARLAPLVKKPDDSDVPPSPLDKEDREPFLSVDKLRTKFIDYLTSKVDEIEEQKVSRHYYHGAQYSAEQIRVLRRRHQPPLTWNRTNRKVNGIIGVVERQRSDPKALPRHVRSEQGADLATEVIRYVLEANDFKGVEPVCLLQSAIDGIAGVQKVLTKDDKGQTDIALVDVIGDEYFYDPKSYRQDFSDARYEGISKWLDLGEAIEMFPDKEEELRGLIQGDADLTTNPDREYRWVITSSQRVRLIEHWYKHKAKWRWAFYVSNTLLDQGVSPFFDERGRSARSFHMFAVAVDHDGDRYGFCRNLKGPQDSLNQSKSKSLHLANSRRVRAKKGAVDDVEKARVEMARPDGWLEVNGPLDDVVSEDQMQAANLAAFTGMADAASQEIDSFASINIAIMTGASLANISGRAIQLLQQPGMAELGPFILAIRRWKLGLYKSIWDTAQRYWTSEKWIRVGDDEDKPVFIQLNALQLDQWGRPVLVNALGALDVDIVIEEGPDAASLMQDTYDMVKNDPNVPFAVKLELAPIPRAQKKRIMALLKPPPNPIQMAALKAQMESATLKNVKLASEARKNDAAAAKAQAESGAIGDQLQMDSAALQHQMWVEALQIAQPPQPPQAGAGGSPGAGAPQPQPQGPMPGLHPAMPAQPAF